VFDAHAWAGSTLQYTAAGSMAQANLTNATGAYVDLPLNNCIELPPHPPPPLFAILTLVFVQGILSLGRFTWSQPPCLQRQRRPPSPSPPAWSRTASTRLPSTTRRPGRSSSRRAPAALCPLLQRRSCSWGKTTLLLWQKGRMRTGPLTSPRGTSCVAACRSEPVILFEYFRSRRFRPLLAAHTSPFSPPPSSCRC
jgi:hypothetical protein